MGTGLVSPWHLILVLVVALLVFGPKRLPEMGRSLGKGMREFKDSISGEDTAAHDESTSATPTTQELPPALPPVSPARSTDAAQHTGTLR